jgi:hypothetical protein
MMAVDIDRSSLRGVLLVLRGAAVGICEDRVESGWCGRRLWEWDATIGRLAEVERWRLRPPLDGHVGR